MKMDSFKKKKSHIAYIKQMYKQWINLFILNLIHENKFKGKREKNGLMKTCWQDRDTFRDREEVYAF